MTFVTIIRDAARSKIRDHMTLSPARESRDFNPMLQLLPASLMACLPSEDHRTPDRSSVMCAALTLVLPVVIVGSV